jgi:hypothetical protein
MTTWLLIVAIVWGSLCVGIVFGWMLRAEKVERASGPPS